MGLSRKTEWQYFAEKEIQLVDKICQASRISPFIVKILLQRGFEDPDTIEKFLRPKLAHLTPPTKMYGMEQAVARLLKAREQNEHVRVFGDYDVDGQTSTSILTLFFREIGITADWELPHRHRDGYGLNPLAVDRAADDGITLLVTCDCGISNAKEVAYALEKGVETIVIDHHRTPPELPPAAAVLNPHQPKCQFPFKGLCAAGVSFYFCAGVRAALRKMGTPVPDLRNYLDLVALGTIADVVPLQEENRIFVRHGLTRLSHANRMGIRALKSVSKLGEGTLSAKDVGFRLAPRLNAAGRLDDAGRGVRLLMTDDPGEAAMLAAELDRENIHRRDIEKNILSDALRKVERLQETSPEFRSIVLASSNWHHGVIGIVASRLVDLYHFPVALIALEGEKGRGSARSIDGFHLFDAFSQISSVFERFGGHAFAAGFSILEEKIPALAKDFDLLVKKTFPQDLPPKKLRLEAQVPLRRLDESLYDELWRLAPFGAGNSEPLLFAKEVEVYSSRIVGQKHLKLQVQNGGAVRSAIGFGMGDLHPVEGLVDLAFYVQKNYFRDTVQVELRLKDIRPSLST